jgi:hypothetical protein
MNLDAIHGNRVRYSPELGVFTLDMGTRSAEAMGQATSVLIAAMEHARNAGILPECTCHAEGVSITPTTLLVQYAEPPQLHKVYSQGGLSVLGHGAVGDGSEMGDPDALNAAMCPLANAEGERRANELVRTDRDALWNLTQPFPLIEHVVLQPGDAKKPPKAWTGDPVDIGRGRTVPGRHVPADVRKAAAAVAFVNGEADDARRAAHEAKRAADEAQREASDAVRRAAASGERMSAEAAGAIIRERTEAAAAAQAVADGMVAAADDARRTILDAIETNRDAWLAYLAEHAAHNLARLDAALAEVDASLAELADIDRIRRTVEKPNASRLFGEASFIATSTGQAVSDLRAAREKAAHDLGTLAKVRAGTQSAA